MSPSEEAIREAFPAVEEIEDGDLRRGVVDAWSLAMAETGVDDLESVPWFPPVQRELDLPDETLVEHVRDVLAAAEVLTAVVEDRGTAVSRDLVLAGALVHDVSKLYEFDGFETTPVGDLLGHPYYGVYVVGAAGLGPELAHVVLSHTRRTPVEPATMEAEIVRRADEIAAAAIRSRALDDLRDA